MKSLLHISLVSIVLSVMACTSFQEEDVPDGLNVDAKELVFSIDGDSKSLTVRSGARWEVSSSPEWISLQSIGQSGHYPYEWSAVFSATANSEYNREGLIRIKAGTETAEITISQDGKKGRYVAVESISVSPLELTLSEGDFSSLSLVITPSNASVQTVSWKSSSPTVATVSQSGRIDALAEGTTLITVTTEDGGKTASCAVTVKAKVIPVSGITLDKTSLSMTEGDEQTLSATVTPTNATDKSVKWSSNNTSVATVSSSGVVTAKAAGSATITVTTTDGGKKATCTVTVQAQKVSVTGVSLNRTSLTMVEGDTQTLTATVTPSNATDKSVTWSSSNTSVATVSSSGVVTAKAAGTAKVTATTNDGGKTATCSVSVSAATVSVTGVSLDKTSLSLTVGDKQTLTATVTPSNATDKSVTWSSNKSSVATVSSSGVVTAKAAGTATITVTTNDGAKKATCSVTVSNATVSVTGVSLNKTSMTMTVGDTQTLTATVTPSNATNKSVSWASNNTSVATVSSSGTVTAKAAGSAIITVSTNDGGKKATCSIIVNQESQGHDFTINKWILNPDYLIGNQNELNLIAPSDYSKSYAPYNRDQYGYGAVCPFHQDPYQTNSFFSYLTEHFSEYMVNLEINYESIYRFEIKNYDINEVDWQVVSGGGTYGSTVYQDGTTHAYIELTGSELIDVIKNPALVPYLFLNSGDILINKDFEILVEIKESSMKDGTALFGYYFVVYKSPKVMLKLYNVKLGTFRAVNDYVYTHELVEGVYIDNIKIIEWSNGSWVATKAAEYYGITDATDLTVEIKSRLTYPYDSEDSFGGNLYVFTEGSAVNSVSPTPTHVPLDSGINWWNNGATLQVDKKARFTISVMLGDKTLVEGVGDVMVLAAANSIHPLHDTDDTLMTPVAYKDGWLYAISE